LQLTNGSRRYPLHKGLAPSRLIPYLRYSKDAHAGHTQKI